jgi:D-3-phosphoglycerate dehydrogenase
MNKILVSDKISHQGLSILEACPDLEVDYAPGLDPADLLDRIQDAHGLVIRSGTKVTRDVIDAAPDLRVIGRAGIGVDNVDLPAATARGIVVVNTPSGNNVTTAEHAIALLVSLARHIPQATASMKQGLWEKSAFTGTELFNRTLGLVGLGNIGRVVADRARGLGMRVIAYDPHLPDDVARKLEVELVDLEGLLSRADVISVHVPKTKETTGLLGAATFPHCKPGVLIINAARGGIIDEAALLDALESGQVGGAALDVFDVEPPGEDHPLVRHPRVICTPHLGASTEQAQLNVAIQVAEQVRDFLLDGVIRNGVNVPSVSPEVLEQLRPYLTLGEKLGRFQGQLCPRAIEEIEVEYAGDVTEMRVEPITVAVLKGLLESVSDRANMVNAPVIARDHGIRVTESKTTRSDDYASTITTRVRGCDNRLIAGAVFHGNQPRIVRLDNFILEAIPEGVALVMHNKDRPGVVGKVGSILGEAGINISRMQLALDRELGEAAMLVNADSAPTEDVIERLRALPNMISIQVVEL